MKRKRVNLATTVITGMDYKVMKNPTRKMKS